MKQFLIKKSIFIVLLLVVTFISCKKKEYKEEDAFIKIYNELDGSKKFYPLGIKQTTDDGYLILSAYNGWNIHLMKINAKGELVWQQNLSSNYVHALSNILLHNGEYYFVCMDQVGLFTYLIQIDENSGAINVKQDFSNILYPTAVYSNGVSIFIQNYDRYSEQTGIHQLDQSLTAISNTQMFNIMTNVEDKIVNHIMYTGKRFPFFIQTSLDNNQIIMSCFYNYSFSLVFLNQNLQFTGVYNGSHFNEGVSALLPLGNSTFSVAKFSFDNLYFHPATQLDPTAIEISASIPGNGMPDLSPDKPVIIKPISIEGKVFQVLAASTRSNQLVLQFYDSSTGVQKAKKYIGQNTPYQICDITPTSDGGLMLLIQAKILSSFDRIATIKLSKEELEKMI